MNRKMFKALSQHCLRSFKTSERQFSTSKKIKAKSYFRGSSNLTFSRSTYGEIFDESTEKNPDRHFIISNHQNLLKTYADVKKDSDDLAAGLLALGLKAGDTIAVILQNIYEFTLLQIAASKSRLRLAAISPTSTAPEIEHFLNKVECKALVFNDIFKGRNTYNNLKKFLPNLTNSTPGSLKANNVPHLKTLIQVSQNKKPGTFILSEVLEGGQGSDARDLLNQMKRCYDPDDCALILFTSGTTGNPKAVQLSHYNTVNNSMIAGINTDLWKEGKTICSPVPFFHSFGSVIGNILSAFYKHTLVLPSDWFDPAKTLEVCEKYSCCTIHGTPTMYLDFLKENRLGKYDLSSLKTASMGGATCQQSVLDSIKKDLKIQKVFVAYGCTETSPLVSVLDTADRSKIPFSVGKVSHHTEIKLVDRNGDIVDVGEEGEILMRGYMVMLGYYKDDDANKKSITNSNWYKSGDVGIFTEDGYLSVSGRMKDMIIRGGENVYPAEIESFISKHPSVLDVQVFGISDERLGEEICAWIHLKKDSVTSENDIKDYCKGEISTFKIPKHIHFVEDFPKTSIGKIQKFKLTEMMEKILASKNIL